MPELPEVETVRRDLCNLVCGCRVTGVEVRCEPMLVRGTPEQLRRSIEGSRIQEIARRGKALILRFSSGWSLVVHFRMTGQLYALSQEAALPQHTRTVFDLEDGRRLVHVDVRRLGTLELVDTAREGDAVTLANIGPDAYHSLPRPQEFRRALARRTGSVKTFLMSQEVISGIGNIYACEILARARVAPHYPANRLTSAQLRRLLAATRAVLDEAVRERGTTISDYRTGKGGEGGFQRRLRVYGREGQRCTRPGCPGIIARMVQAGRSTYWCPVCQGTGPNQAYAPNQPEAGTPQREICAAEAQPAKVRRRP